MTSPARSNLRRALVLGLASWAGLAMTSLPAQVAVTGVTYGASSNNADVTVGSLTYLNQTRAVQSVNTAGMNYVFDGNLAQNVYFRRNTSAGNPNNSTVFYQYSSTGQSSASVFSKGDSTPTMQEVMLSNDLSQGLRNPFANDDSSSNSLSTNIERMDFYLPNHVVTAGDALVFFDLENVGNFGDGFRIAAFSSWGTYSGTANAPTAYVNSGLLVQPNTFGDPVTTPDGTNGRYLRSTTTNGDTLSGTQSLALLDSNSNSDSDLSLVGIVIRLSDLGLQVGQTIQGFSLMAGDVAPSTATDLLNWNNSSVYKTNTSSADWGNMDFMGFGGRVARPVPEPSTYGMMLIGACGALWIWRRRRTSRATT